MMKIEKNTFVPVFILLLGLVLSGCAITSSKMQLVPPEKVVSVAEEGKSMIIFMRSSNLGGAIQSSVFEIKNGNPVLVGIISADTKISYQLDPGSHLFMVVGESADFMSAELESNKTYYVRVSPRMGLWKARFSLEPIHSVERDSPVFNESLEECRWVRNTAASDAWANENMSSILSKQQEYHVDWMEKPASDRPKLLPKDGM